MYFHNGLGCGVGFLGSMLPILWWVLVIGIIYFAFKHYSKNNLNNDKSVDILKERYAKGEINKDQFEEMKKNLN
jgi:putative membrane protein